jgi:pimeloyl-ACP methyl ester carboxylesterase
VGTPALAIRIAVADVVEGTGEIEGDLRLPADARALVIFAHGSGSSRRSPRNRMVAEAMNDVGMATLLFDLLTPAEEAVDVQTGRLRFDIALLAERLIVAGAAIAARPDTAELPVGTFGASTGAAAALVAAAERPASVRAVVSRGGRPDLAGTALPLVRAPTLLIVGGRDPQVLDMNRDAAARLTCEHDLVIVPGATHLFEEAGTLEEVSRLAIEWFTRHLIPHPSGATTNA